MGFATFRRARFPESGSAKGSEDLAGAIESVRAKQKRQFLPGSRFAGGPLNLSRSEWYFPGARTANT